MMKRINNKKINTSWDKVAKWYDQKVGNKGHYYHQEVIIPNLLRLLKLNGQERILDVGCGQGVLGKQLIKNTYVGIDISNKLIESAIETDRNRNHKYLVGDATKKLNIEGLFNRAVMILSLQNIKQPFLVVKNIAEKLEEKGQLILVLNHPCFRIPQNSDWGYDSTQSQQYRKIYKYFQPLKLEIKANPFRGKSQQSTLSFHYPLSTYSEMLTDNGLVITKIEEWLSPKISEGGRAKEENEARSQIPMFLTLVAKKISYIL